MRIIADDLNTILFQLRRNDVTRGRLVRQQHFHFEFGNLICGCSYEISQTPEPELLVVTPWGVTTMVLEKRDPLTAAQVMALELAKAYKCPKVRSTDETPSTACP